MQIKKLLLYCILSASSYFGYGQNDVYFYSENNPVHVDSAEFYKEIKEQFETGKDKYIGKPFSIMYEDFKYEIQMFNPHLDFENPKVYKGISLKLGYGAGLSITFSGPLPYDEIQALLSSEWFKWNEGLKYYLYTKTVKRIVYVKTRSTVWRPREK
ncbi:MAG: hypothetical protein ACFCUU_15880 [Cyclobacteriaceae bacterium]